MADAAAPMPQARSTALRIVSISGLAIGTFIALTAAAIALVSHFAIKVVAASAADVLARMI